MKQEKIIDYFILLYKPEHHRAFISGYVPEHILIAEDRLGRNLTPDEDVKHINGNTRDNSPDNLKITSGSYKVLTLSQVTAGHKPAKTFVPCKYQKECWSTIRAPIAKKNKIFLPYVCSYQSEGDIYMCGNLWTFHEKEKMEVDSLQTRGSSGDNIQGKVHDSPRGDLGGGI